MSKPMPPLQKGRHLRLVPPLPPPASFDGSATSGGGGQTATSWRQAQAAYSRAFVPDASRPSWLQQGRPFGAAQQPYALTAMLVTALCAATAAYVYVGDKPDAQIVLAPGLPVAGTPDSHSPRMTLYARQTDTTTLGRPLQEGDSLSAKDHLVIGIHNAPSLLSESAQFAAVFAMDTTGGIAPLYPALGGDALAMPLPQVASMALLDGPQLTGDGGPVTLVAIFLRQQVPLASLIDALRAKNALTQRLALAPELEDAVLRLQKITLNQPQSAL